MYAGGAWTIGYKAWGSLLGRRLSKQGVLVCCLDYRNFPQVRLTSCMAATVVSDRPQSNVYGFLLRASMLHMQLAAGDFCGLAGRDWGHDG